MAAPTAIVSVRGQINSSLIPDFAATDAERAAASQGGHAGSFG